MSDEFFRVIEHIVPCQHVREYLGAIKSQKDDALHLAVKQYIPRGPPLDDARGVTIIGAHANGFLKEAYEPLWDDLLVSCRARGVHIRGIWMADISNQGASGVLNEQIQGDDPSFFDHSRDLLQVINTFRAEMLRPIIGIGHSVGATQLMMLSVMHPRLFASLLFLEPMIQEDVPPGANFAMPSSLRTDIWPNYSAAETAFRNNKFLKQLDSRVLNNMIKHGLRKVPTAIYPLSDTVCDGSYTLTTSKHQEVWSYLRSNFEPRVELSPGEGPSHTDRLLAPDVNHHWQGTYLFYGPELAISFEYLAYVRPPVFYVFGGKSSMSTPLLQAAKMNRTGVGLGGGGGVRAGQVQKRVFEGWGHVFPLEHVAETGETLASYLGERMKAWTADEKLLKEHQSRKSERGMLVISKDWLKYVRNHSTAQRPTLGKL